DLRQGELQGRHRTILRCQRRDNAQRQCRRTRHRQPRPVLRQPRCQRGRRRTVCRCRAQPSVSGRELQKAQTPDGLREGWVAVQSAWQATVASTPPDLVDAHVEDEWSLAQTLRHLILATDAWLRGAIMQIEQPFHKIGQIFTGADEMGFDMSIFRADPPDYEEILTVRAERQRMVTNFLATVTPE